MLSEGRGCRSEDPTSARSASLQSIVGAMLFQPDETLMTCWSLVKAPHELKRQSEPTIPRHRMTFMPFTEQSPRLCDILIGISCNPILVPSTVPYRDSPAYRVTRMPRFRSNDNREVRRRSQRCRLCFRPVDARRQSRPKTLRRI